MRVIDTNLLIYAVDEASEYQITCLRFLEELRNDPSPSFLTWSICYEFIRVCTHPRVLRSPRSSRAALRFLEELLNTPGFSMLTPTERHADVLSLTLADLPDIRGSIAHDLHIAVLMREHGVSRICTHDADFHRFPFLTVIDPTRTES